MRRWVQVQVVRLIRHYHCYLYAQMKAKELNAHFTTVLFGLATFLSVSGAYAQNKCERALTVYESTLVEGLKPQVVTDKPSLNLSLAFNDPWLELGRQTRAWKDFKKISDLEALNLSAEKKKDILEEASHVEGRIYQKLMTKGINSKKAKALAKVAYSRWIINHLFRLETGLKSFSGPLVNPRLKLKDSSKRTGLDFLKLQSGFAHTEKMWSVLAKQSAPSTNSSLLPTPFPMMVAGERFDEGYYWDAYIGAIALVNTGRFDMAAAQLENFLHMIQVYGKVPNGFRQYYLGRSQPPVLPLFAKLIYDTFKTRVDRTVLDHWWKERVYPLLMKDYNGFWRELRFDPTTNLYFHDDNLEEILGRKEVLRPERHSNDDEYCLGKTPRDVRAEAEYGRDHTDASMGSCSRLATVELNSLMVAYARLLADMSDQFGETSRAKEFRSQAFRTKSSMNKYLWDDESGVFRNFHLVTKTKSDVVASDNFWTLHTQVATGYQARRIIEFAERHLEGGAGLRGSTAVSSKQWDSKYYWAVDNIVAAMGASEYGHDLFAQRITVSFLEAASDIFEQTGHFYEKIGEDQLKGNARPGEDKTKYPNQTGFLWTNSYFVWGLKYLGYQFK